MAGLTVGAPPCGRPCDGADGRPHGAAPTRDGENERWSPCPAGEEVSTADERRWTPMVRSVVGAPPCGRPCDGADGRPHGAAPTRDGENERWSPCPAGEEVSTADERRWT